MLVTLSIVMCLAGQPHIETRCQTLWPSDEDRIQASPSACMLRGMELSSIYAEEHPKWEFDRVRCTPGNAPRGDDI